MFLLKELFQKDNLTKVFKKFLSDRLQEIDKNDIPENYQEVVEKNIILEEELLLGKIKYDDKILHTSKLLKIFYRKNESEKSTKRF